MTLKGIWKVRAKRKRKRKKLRNRASWTTLCVCGHPYINHQRMTVAGTPFPSTCPCGCDEFRRAMSKNRRRT